MVLSKIHDSHGGVVNQQGFHGHRSRCEHVVEHLDTRKDHVSMLLSFGATPYEAAWPAYIATFRQEMIPAINGMNVIGLVSI